MTLGVPYDFRVDIAPGAAPDGDSSLWRWTDIAAYRRQSSDIELNVGRDDEASTVEAADSSLELDDRDGYLSPRNPYSELYGQIGTNTPIRYRLADPLVVDAFGRTVALGWGTADSGQAWTTSVAYSVASGGGKATFASSNLAAEAILSGSVGYDYDLIYSAAMSAVTTGGPWISAVEVRREDANNTYRVHTEFKPSGVVTIKITRREDSVNTDIVENLSVPATYTVGSKVWTRIQVDGPIIRAKTWSGLISAQPDAWAVTADNVGRVDGTTFGFYQWRFGGNTNVGSLTVTIDDLEIYPFIWSGNVPEWPPRWDKSGNDSTMPIAAAGPLRRITAGDDPIKSPLTRQLPTYGPVGYWPFEDDAGAARAASGLAGGLTASVQGVTFNADADALPGAVTMAKLDAATSKVSGTVSGDSGAAWAAMTFFQLAAIPGAGDFPLIEYRTQSTVVRWQIVVTSTGFEVFGWDSDGVKIIDTGPSTYTIDPLRAFSIQLEITQSSGNIAWALLWNQVGEETNYAKTGTVAGTIGRIREFRLVGNAALVDLLFGHVWLGPESLPYVNNTFRLVSDGYRGELARDRITRLCIEEGVQISARRGDSEPQGRQTVDTFVNLVRLAAESDPGILYERGIGLGYIPRGARYHVPVALTLDWAAGELSEAPLPTDDDQRLRNRWTISRKDGSSATYQDDASIARHGLIKDSAEINIESDNRLLPWAAWQTNLSTFDELRWPAITVDLVAHPELIPFVLGMRVGSRLVIVNPKDQIPGVTIDLIVEGIKYKLGRYCWTVEFACSPAAPWDVAIYDDAAHRYKYDAATTTLATGRDATQTSWPITSVKATEAWSTTGVPYPWQCGGEVVTVTAITAAVGSGPVTQTATVTRGVNGVTVPHTSGDKVHLARPAQWGL